jgi:hypothetical protein
MTNSFKDLKNFYYESDKESSNFKNSLGEFNTEKNNNLICNFRNIKHNHNQSYSRFGARKAAYEKSAKNISFSAFKMNNDRANEIKKLNFMNSQNRIRILHNNFLPPENSCFGIKDGSLNLIKNNYEKGDEYNEGNKSEGRNSPSSIQNGITCKMISDAEIIINWLRRLRIKDVEELKFFDDAYKDNTKYMKYAKKENIMNEIKKG